jgi:SAM-dependent methyltransferase
MRICLRCAATLERDTWKCSSCGWQPTARDGFPDLAVGGGLEGFVEESFGLLPALEEQSFWFRARNELIGWALDTYAPDAGSFLELGCGTGFVLQSLARSRPAMRLVGGDPYAAGLRTAADRAPTAELLLLDGRRLPYRDEFDAAGAFDVLEHVDDDYGVLDGLREALRPGGILFVTVPQHPWLWSPVDEFSRHLRRYRRRDLVERVSHAGFEVLRVTSFVSLLLPLVLLSRLRQRRSTAPVDPLAEYQIEPRIDRLLERVLAVERSLIGRGLSLPAGSSLLVVARRRRERSEARHIIPARA